MKTTTHKMTMMVMVFAVGLVLAGAGIAFASGPYDMRFAGLGPVINDPNGITYHGVAPIGTMEVGSKDFAENGITTFAKGPVDSDVGLGLAFGESMDNGYAAGGLAEEPALFNGISSLDPGTVSRDN